MNEKDSITLQEKYLRDISDYLHGNERQIQNNEYLKNINTNVHFWKEDGEVLTYISKIYAEIEWAKSMRFYQFVVLVIIAISVVMIAYKI